MKSQIEKENQRAISEVSRNIKVIALDCDGVLFDSREANIQFYTHIMQQVGRPPVRPDQHEYIHMHPVRQSLIYLIGDEDEDFIRAYEYFKTIDFAPFNGYLQREPGLTEFLDLAKRNFRTALATNRTVSTLELLEYYDIAKFFDLVVCASDVQHPKPHPDIMQRILSAFATNPGQVLYVGDSRVDEDFAKATGVVFVAYKNPGLDAPIHVDHFRELHALFSPNSKGRTDNGG